MLLVWLGWAISQAFVVSSSLEAAVELQQLAASYVDEYQKQLTAIVADEVYVQEIRAQIPAEEGAPRFRTTRGDDVNAACGQLRETLVGLGTR